MQVIFGLFSQVLSIYSLLLVARIMLTWFTAGNERSGIAQFLARITDPYLNWWRQRFSLRAGFLDLTPLVALATLRVLQTVFHNIAVTGTFSTGFVLALILATVWQIFAFLLWFCIIVLVIRLVGYFANSSMYGPFWQIVDTIARPLMFRITGIVFRGRKVGFVTGMITSIVLFIALWGVGGRIFWRLGEMLKGRTIEQSTEDLQEIGLLIEMLVRPLV